MEVNRVTNQLEWRILSQKFSTLVSAGKTNNAAFSWNYVISKEDLFYKPLVDILDKKPVPSSFFFIPTKIHGTRENNYLYLWPDACNPKVVATIRWKKCYYNDGELRWPVEKENYSILLTPFLIHGQVPIKNYIKLFNRLKKDIPKQYGSLLDLHGYEKNGLSFKDRWMAQVTELVLCQLLCRRFFLLMLRKEDLSALQKCVDIDTIVRNYISLTDTFEVGVSEKKRLMH